MILIDFVPPLPTDLSQPGVKDKSICFFNPSRSDESTQKFQLGKVQNSKFFRNQKSPKFHRVSKTEK